MHEGECKGIVAIVYIMKEYGGVEAHLHSVLTSQLERSEWPVSRSGPFAAGEGAPVRTDYEAGLGSSFSLDELEHRKPLACAGNRCTIFRVFCSWLSHCTAYRPPPLPQVSILQHSDLTS